MVDYAINGDFDIYFNNWNDFATVDELREFEEDLAVRLHHDMREIIQFGFTETSREKISLAVNRAAEEFDVIETIENVTIRESINRPETFEVEIEYATGERFSEQF